MVVPLVVGIFDFHKFELDLNQKPRDVIVKFPSTKDAFYFNILYSFTRLNVGN